MKAINFFVLFLIVINASCKQPKDLVYLKTQNFGVSTTGTKQETRISADISFYNPNKYPLKLKKADLDILLNGNPAGKMSVKEHIFIPGLDTFSLPVTLDVNLQTLFPNALQILFNGEINLRFTGHLKVARHGVLINIPVNYESRQDLRAMMGQ